METFTMITKQIAGLKLVEPIDDKIKIAIGNHETGAILTELMNIMVYRPILFL